MTPEPTLWDLEPHTRAKHDLLQRYLAAWYPILSTYRGRIVFLDGFAGPGVYAGGEPGSPCLALETLLGHAFLPRMSHCEFRFIFNEKDTKRLASLEASVKDVEARHGGLPPNVKVDIVGQPFTELAADIIESLGTNSLAPTFAFLDPFGFTGVPMQMIKDLLSYNNCELFIYFDHNSASRFSTSGVVDPQLEALFGTDEFKKAPPAGDSGRGEFLRDLYDRQLSEFCGFDFVQSFQMINKQGRTGNYMFFCSRNVKGLRIMKEAMWKIDPSGNYRFSDRLAGQEVLFVDEVDTKPLQEALLEAFSGQTKSIEDIEYFTISATPYCASHVKKKTLKEMQKAGVIKVPHQKRQGTYPPGTLVQFP